MKVSSDSPQKTIEIGIALGKLLKPGSVVLLKGDLGAGKTQLAKGVALGLGVADHVTSPTFTIINEYEGRLPFYHVDAYRLGDPGEAFDLGLEEYFFGGGVTLVEWPERVISMLPDEYLMVMMSVTGLDQECREVIFLPSGQTYEEIIGLLPACIEQVEEVQRS